MGYQEPLELGRCLLIRRVEKRAIEDFHLNYCFEIYRRSGCGVQVENQLSYSKQLALVPHSRAAVVF